MHSELGKNKGGARLWHNDLLFLHNPVGLKGLQALLSRTNFRRCPTASKGERGYVRTDKHPKQNLFNMCKGSTVE